MRTVNVYQDLVELVFDYVASTPDIFLEFSLEFVGIDLMMPEGDELLRFEIIYDTREGDDVLVIAEGEIDHEFNLNLRILEE